MEEVGAQVASPIFIHQSLAGRFCDERPMAKKRNQPASFPHQNPLDNWNPMSWGWDSARFIARPLQPDVVRGGNATPVQLKVSIQKAVQNDMADPKKPVPVEDKHDNENLRLKLGGEGDGRNGVLALVEEPQPVSRPNKRVRSGSPGGASYPVCQVDNCKEDLSAAKDYHRRHKVCEVHSKASKALVGKQMQRFCQQCSRFHPLSEFDEGKRSCRRRLAGHNRRRRKTQPDDATSRLLVPESRDKSGNSEVDIVNLLAVLANAQGNTDDGSSKFSSIPDKDQLIQLLDKINSLKPRPENIAAKLPGCSNGSIPNLVSSGNQSRLSGNVSLPPTVDLLSVLSENPAAPSSGVVEFQSQPSSDRSDSEKSKSAFVDQATCLNLQKGPALEFPSVGGERSSASYHSPVADSDCHVQETCPNLLLKLFNSSPEDDSLRKLPSGRNYFSSDSSNPSLERSPSSSPPVVHDLFPMHTSREPMKHGSVSTSEVDTMYAKASTSNECSTSLKLFGVSTRAAENGSIQSSPYQAGYTSSTGSDHSPSSLNSGVQDRNGRIVFKLFDKDPSHLPESLRAQIYNWLANSPSEIESYIRPGCIVLSVYLSMSSYAWDQLERNLLDYVKSLVNDINTDFWRNGRFLVHTDKQMASYKDGKIHLCKSWRAWNTPELVLVSPVAVVGGQETSLILRGRNLTIPGTKIHCTHTNGYSIKEFPASACQETVYDEISLGSFKIHGPSSVLGRCFIEVENGLRGTSFPVIIADNTVCQELRLLESVINEGALLHDGTSSDHIQNPVRPRTREEVLHFLGELGWLFQRKNNSSLFESPDYRLSRFKFLLTFSVEHDFCALIKTLLDILLEINLGHEWLARESLEMLSESHLLNRAVNRRCRRMVDLLIHYSISDSTDSSMKYIFVPNMAGPGGITPLHLAASTLGSDDMVDALTSDPQEIGLHCWNSVLDANGLSPYAYALMRNNHSYNKLVAQKLADKKNFQVSVSIGNNIEQVGMEVDHGHKTTFHINQGRKSCSKCAAAAGRCREKFPGSQGLLQRPYIHSMLAIAAVCVCVCLFFRGAPDIGSVAPFKWENLGYGPL
ncbi:unnamed protein product [Fraxinus pennsylvanica]|uniref:SBP-type domain-containing protein n=1 Tax=Fraxinus pennsylvanica TaxID=56036 RepID=A0AAD1ZWW3_9LAMI|nr:unnamed protein product [Fraxinus pennsylvanica]